MSADAWNSIGDIITGIVIWSLIYQIEILNSKVSELEEILKPDKNINSISKQNQDRPDCQAAHDSPE